MIDNDVIERVSSAVHEKWMETKRSQNVTTRLAEDGEELMVPYHQLSEKAKELDRGSVRAVLAALESVGYEIVDPEPTAAAI